MAASRGRPALPVCTGSRRPVRPEEFLSILEPLERIFRLPSRWGIPWSGADRGPEDLERQRPTSRTHSGPL